MLSEDGCGEESHCMAPCFFHPMPPSHPLSVPERTSTASITRDAPLAIYMLATGAMWTHRLSCPNQKHGRSGGRAGLKKHDPTSPTSPHCCWECKAVGSWGAAMFATCLLDIEVAREKRWLISWHMRWAPWHDWK